MPQKTQDVLATRTSEIRSLVQSLQGLRLADGHQQRADAHRIAERIQYEAALMRAELRDLLMRLQE